MTPKNRYEKKCKAKALNLRDVSKTSRNILYLIKYPVQTCTTAIDPKMLRDIDLRTNESERKKRFAV